MDMEKEEDRSRGLWKMFSHCDIADMILMLAGFVGSVGDGLAFPGMLIVLSKLMNNVGRTISDDSYVPQILIHSLNKNALFLCKVAATASIFCFLGDSLFALPTLEINSVNSKVSMSKLEMNRASLKHGYSWTRTAERQATRMQARYLKAVLRQDVSYFDMSLNSISEVVTSVSSDTLVIQECISEKVPNFLMNFSTFVGCYLVAFILLWRLAIMAIPFLFLLVVPGIVYGRVLMSLSRKMRDEYDKAGSIAEQSISSIRTVYAFVGESKTVSTFSEALQGLVSLGLKQGLAKGFAMGSNGLTFAIWSFNTWYATRLVMYHGAKGGTAFAIGVCINVGGLSFGTSLSNLKYLSEACSAAERISKVINRVPSIDSNNMHGKVLDNLTGEVEFKNVEFAYPSRPETLILHGFSLNIPARKTVALVGRSGSGKSTVISLLQRFYNPIRGQILLDGISIDKLQVNWLRSQMGMVSQEPALFATSIKENILFDKENASMEDVIEAAKSSNAHDFICQLPQGYETMVGERGVQLSGGQRQRIAIARAVIRKPQIFLLDEATSALDSQSEHKVQQALDHVSIGTTTIIIAHRLSTIRHAQIISIIQDGHVVEIGSHEELIHLPGSLYSSLQQQQQQQQTGEKQPQDSHYHDYQQMDPSTINDQLSLTTFNEFGGDESLCKDNKPKKPSFKRLMGLNLPEWKMGLLGCLGAILFGAVQPLYSFMMGTMITIFFLQSHEEIKRQTRIFSPCFAGLAIVAFVTNAMQHYCFAYIGEKLTMRVREKMLTKIMSFEVGWLDRNENSTGAICSRLANDPNAVRCLVGDRTSVLLQAGSLVLISSIMGLIIAWRLALVMIAVQPLIIACFYTRRVLLRSMSMKSQKSQEKSSNLASEAISNIRTVVSFSSQCRILQMLKEAQVCPHQESIRQSWYTGISLATSQSLTILFSALSFWYGGKLLVHGDMNAEQILQTIMILERTGRVIADVGSMITDLAKGSDSVQSVFEVLDRVTEIRSDNPEGQKLDEIIGHVEIKNVDFVYPSRPCVIVLKGFSLDIHARKSTALVGQSGSGKSSVIGLIERFYDPICGVVKIDGHDVRTYHLKSLRKHMTLVSQEPTLFAGTVRENILYGTCKDIDESEVVEAAKAANAHDFISALKDGYDTCCGHKGIQLSGGQKQRIAIARAVLKNPRILLLDEATSALDNHSERAVQGALEQMMVGRTSLVVAHKLSTIQNCDIIVVIDKGKIVETGNHHSLLAKGSAGAYYSLFNLQISRHDM